MGQEGHRGRTRQEGWEEAQKRERGQRPKGTLRSPQGLRSLHTKAPSKQGSLASPTWSPTEQRSHGWVTTACPYIAAYSRVSPAQGTASKTFGVHRDWTGSLGDINSYTSRCWATTHKKTENPLPGQQAFCRSRAASSQPLGSLKTE